jgi:hypothetical protein
LVTEQIQLQRFADDFLARAGQGLDASAERLGTDDGRLQVLRLKLICGSSVLSVVSGPNPNANLLDTVSVTVLMRKSVEDYWMKTTNGAAFEPWLEASRVLETNVWRLAARFLTAVQIDELRKGIDEWYASTPEIRSAFFARPYALTSMIRNEREEQAAKTSVFNIVNLDPAVREVIHTRLFGERVMFTMQRMPFLLRLQAELLAQDLSAQPSVQLAISNSLQVSASLERMSRAAEGVSHAITQLPDRLSAERKEILATADRQEGKLRDLASEANRAFASAEKMSGSLSIAITNFDAVLKRLGVGEADRTNSQPFQVLDYAKTADQVANMATNLNTLMNNVNQSAPELQRLDRQATADLQKVLNHGFWLGLLLIAILLIGSVLAGLLYTFLARKLKRHAAGPA